MKKKLKKTILVSGAGSGIGRGIVQELDLLSASNGFLLLGRNEKNLEKTRSSLREPKSHVIMSLDQRHSESMKNAFAHLHADGCALDVVVANAGVALSNDGIDENWQETLDTNLTGTYRLILEALPLLRRSKSAYKHIVIISSTLAVRGLARCAAYCATKAALLGLMRALAVELASERILVNAICPSWVDTAIAERARANMQSQNISEAMARKILSQSNPLRKITQPKEVGRLVGYLVGDDQISMTGQTLHINNGEWMS